MTPAEAITWADVFEKMGMGFAAMVVTILGALKAPPFGPFFSQWLKFKLDEMANQAMRDHGKSIATTMKDALDIDHAEPADLATAANAAVAEKLSELEAKGLMKHMVKVAGSPDKLRASMLAVAEKHIGAGVKKAIKEMKKV